MPSRERRPPPPQITFQILGQRPAACIIRNYIRSTQGLSWDPGIPKCLFLFFFHLGRRKIKPDLIPQIVVVVNFKVLEVLSLEMRLDNGTAVRPSAPGS